MDVLRNDVRIFVNDILDNMVAAPDPTKKAGVDKWSSKESIKC